MKLPGFLGGNDVQRSSNHAANRCVNLYATPNDDGSIGALVTTPGLTAEVTNPASAITAGIYTASNGRCFEVAGATLYELTSTAGVISTTSRGTVTAGTVCKMSDNGLELIIVNGTDGWIFTFADNVLKQIKLLQGEFTVTQGDKNVLGSGILTAMTPASIQPSSNVYAIAVSPNGASVYAVGTAKIFMYDRDIATGAMSATSPPSIACGSGTSSFDIAVSPDNLHVYVTNYDDDTISQYSRNADTGRLTALSTATVATGNGPLKIAISQDGKFVYSLNTLASTISVFSRNLTTGLLTLASTPATGGAGNEIKISPDGGSVYVTNPATNVIFMFVRNNSTGALTATVPASIATGVTPAGLTISTNSNFVYCNNSGASTISQYSRDPFTSLLTALTPATVVSNTASGDMEVSPDGASLYLAGVNVILFYNMDASSGQLAALSTASVAVTTGGGLAVSPEGTHVYECYGKIELFSRDDSYDSSTAVFTMAAHNLVADDRFRVSTTGILPGGVAGSTTYHVLSTDLTVNTFKAAETQGGDALTTAGSQSGVHTLTTVGYGFPEGCETVDYLNGRFIACEPDTQNFYCSEVLDGLYWDALNVQTVDSNPDNVVTQAVIRNELVMFCTDSLEIYDDSGTLPSPFIRNSSGIASVGCAAAHSVVNLDNTVYWLGRNEIGQGVIYKLSGYTPARVSNYTVEIALQGMSDISDAIAFAYQQDGHFFYVISFPVGNKTFALDLSTNLWAERASFSGGDFSRWEATHHAFFVGKHLVSDFAEGKIYSMAMNVYADGTATHKWLRSFACPGTDMQRMRHSRLEIHLERGVGLTGAADPQAMLRWSDDGGHTWSSEVWASMGAIGEYGKRVVFNRLGTTRGQPRIYELSGTAAVKTALLEAHLS